MFASKIKVSKELFDKLKAAVEASGAASMADFVNDVLDRECEKIFAQFKNKGSRKELSDQEVDEIANKLKGLGYLD